MLINTHPHWDIYGNIDKCLLSLSQIPMQAKWLQWNEIISQLWNGVASNAHVWNIQQR